MKFELTILGCGSAIPTLRRNPSSQVLNVKDKLYLIDCAEGTQIQMRKNGIKFQRLNHIFISHMHGDHYLGLFGLLSSMHLLGRENEIQIHGPEALKELVEMHLKFAHSRFRYEIKYNAVEQNQHKLIYENDSIEVWSIPLKHKIPCNGFLFREKKRPRNIIKEKIEEFDIGIKDVASIKQGDDFVAKDGEIIPNRELTKAPLPPRAYAYCSDTAYFESIVEFVKEVDLLYHEATFLEEDANRANETQHSTTKEAATIANKANAKKLIIGHYSARYAEIDEFLYETKQIFENTELCEDGKVITI